MKVLPPLVPNNRKTRPEPAPRRKTIGPYRLLPPQRKQAKKLRKLLEPIGKICVDTKQKILEGRSTAAARGVLVAVGTVLSSFLSDEVPASELPNIAGVVSGNSKLGEELAKLKFSPYEYRLILFIVTSLVLLLPPVNDIFKGGICLKALPRSWSPLYPDTKAEIKELVDRF